MNHLHTEILDAVQARQTWESRQATWYKMRHDGLRRMNKPFAGAADMHFPLGDMLIEKLKPFYLSQLYVADTVAAFTSVDPSTNAQQQEAALWFDYHLKQCSNFEDEIAIAVDKMLNCASVPVKVYWHAASERLRFEAINPIHLIVPPQTGRISEADWIVHVQHYSKHAYKRLPGFACDEDTLNAITGGSQTSGSGVSSAGSYDQAKATREGITHTTTKDQIIVWEVYTRTPEGGWMICTYCPEAPDRPLRPDFGLPYNRGVFGEKEAPPPFFDLTMERKDRGYYDPRGIMERIAPFEASLCKDWNTDKDYQTLTCSPVFSAKNGIPNTQNLTMRPGQILPFELSAVAMPGAPVDIQRSMMGTRSVAEQLIAAPDFGTQQQGKDNKTAKEVSLIASVMGQASDMRTRQFRRELSAGLRMGWAILLQYAGTSNRYRDAFGNFSQLTPETLAAEYVVEVNGSGDNWNRTMVVQKAQNRFQMLRGDPFINQEELRRDLLNSDDPRLTKRLLLNAGNQQAAQLEDQAQELSIMLLGFPAEVKETDDDVAHLQSIAGFVQRRTQLGEPLTAETLGLLAQHSSTHAAKLKQTQPDRWKQSEGQLAPFIQQLTAAAQAAMQQQQAAAAPAPASAPTTAPAPMGLAA
jgi:hypothetical protein